MLRYLARRLLRGLAAVWLVLTIVFVAPRLAGDPSRHLLPDDASVAERAELRHRLGLDLPIARQYLVYLTNAVKGDFGESFRERRPVSEAVLERLPPTLQLSGLAFALAVLVGVSSGVVAAQDRSGALGTSLMFGAFLGQAVPNFVVGLALILAFSLHLQLLPSGGRGDWPYLLMPVATLAASAAAGLARLTRAVMLEVQDQDYMRTARAKGVARPTLAVKHALRNAALPVLTLLGLRAGTLVAGSVVVETLFAWPGLGRLLVTSVVSRDFPMVQFTVVLICASVVAANLLVDLLYAVADPRVRTA
jgi:peptide/nickel transport system permease protein